MRNKLLRESRWSRALELPGGSELIESKFLTDGIQISAEEVASFWSGISVEEKQEFIVSYISKPWISAEDEKIIAFLMDNGSPEVWSMLAALLPRYSDKDKATRFLLERIRDEDAYPKGNYFQALEAVATDRLSTTIVDVLAAKSEAYERLMDDGLRSEKEVALAHPVWDYLVCCRTLFQLSKDEKYLKTIKVYSSSADPQLQNWALRLLSATGL